jgi:hypothetical protein
VESEVLCLTRKHRLFNLQSPEVNSHLSEGLTTAAFEFVDNFRRKPYYLLALKAIKQEIAGSPRHFQGMVSP